LQEAVTLYRRALRKEPYFPEACFNLARLLEKLGDQQGARELWRRYLDMDPTGEWAGHVNCPQEDSQEEPPEKDPSGSSGT